MNEKILPCPFCGGKDIRFDCHRSHLSPTGEIWSMGCFDCRAQFPNRYKKELLVKNWNTRHNLTEKLKRALRAAILKTNRTITKCTDYDPAGSTYEIDWTDEVKEWASLCDLDLEKYDPPMK